MALNEHLNKSDIQIWQRVFDILEGDNMRAMQVVELQSLMLEIQQRLMSLRDSHAYVAKELDGQEHDNDFWRKAAASALADRDRANDRIAALEALLANISQSVVMTPAVSGAEIYDGEDYEDGPTLTYIHGLLVKHYQSEG